MQRLDKVVCSNDKPAILVFKEKYGPRVFLIQDRKALERACLKIVKERFAREWYKAYPVVQHRAERVIREENGQIAVTIIEMRGDFEYEEYTVEHPEIP
jgi:hypothetical protein